MSITGHGKKKVAKPGGMVYNLVNTSDCKSDFFYKTQKNNSQFDTVLTVCFAFCIF